MNYLVQIRPYRLPLRAAVRTAHGVIAERSGVALRLEDTATGHCSYGEAAPLPQFGGCTVEGAQSVLGTLGGRATAKQLAAIALHGGCVAFAVESALAAIGSSDGKGNPIVGGPNSLPVAALLPTGRAALSRIGMFREAGFRIFKWKVGVAPPAEELPLLDDICGVLPPGARLRLDANGAWDRRAAELWLDRCAERPVEFVEQPCLAAPGASANERARSEDLLRGLAGSFPTPLALDESLVEPGDVDRWLAVGWRGVWVIKPALVGGVALARLRAAGADVVFSSALETAVGARAALRLAFAWAEETPQAVSAGIKKSATVDERSDTETGRTKKQSGGRERQAEADNMRADPLSISNVTNKISPAPRALGFGVWPLFADARLDGPHAAPFLRAREVEAINVEAAWNALT